MSLSAAVESEWLDVGTRRRARALLDVWEKAKPDLGNSEVQDWVHQVLGYFKNCWRGTGQEPECWHVSNLRMTKSGEVPDGYKVTDHAGVHYIRKFYPDFFPATDHFTQAYWGTKPERNDA
jgi:hypothetical protein